MRDACRCLELRLLPATLLTTSLSLPPFFLPAICRLGDVVSLVCEMGESGLRPDAFTFSAILNACQRADEAELALDVAK